MAANTGVVFSASVSIQMEATVSLTFTFGSFPKVTVPRNPTSSSSTFESNTVTGVRFDLTAPSFVVSRVPELDATSMATSFPRVTRHPAGSVDDLLTQIDRVGRSIPECIQLGEYALQHHDDLDRVLYGLRTTTRARSYLNAPSFITSRVSELDVSNMTTSLPRVTRHPARPTYDLFTQIDRAGRSIAECIQLGESALCHHDNSDRVPYRLRNATATYSDQI